MGTSHEKSETLINGAVIDALTSTYSRSWWVSLYEWRWYYAACRIETRLWACRSAISTVNVRTRPRWRGRAVPAAIVVRAGGDRGPHCVWSWARSICTLLSQIQCILLQNLFAIVFPFNICAFSFFDKDENPHHEGGKVFLRKKTFYSKLQVFPLKCYSQKAKNAPKCAKNGFMEMPVSVRPVVSNDYY